ncbi:Hypothetical protein D9617_7g030990 [Elsinoe fawcettii]|nr:Hypothetical protein D9617_7g030990 [Elsinoe fawcettii]
MKRCLKGLLAGYPFDVVSVVVLYALLVALETVVIDRAVLDLMRLYDLQLVSGAVKSRRYLALQEKVDNAVIPSFVDTDAAVRLSTAIISALTYEDIFSSTQLKEPSKTDENVVRVGQRQCNTGDTVPVDMSKLSGRPAR